MEKHFSDYAAYENSAVKEGQFIRANGVRISVLTPYLFRIEEQSSSVFCDDPTQTVINRSFDAPFFSYVRTSETITFKTEKIKFEYSYKLRKLLRIVLENGTELYDFKKGNLKGTCRTLDQTHGATKLEDGIISKNGVGILDDSKSLIIESYGKILPRKVKGTDVYYFAYGHKYIDAIKDYFNLTGHAPLIPRFAFGNWWSRYKAYTQQEYIDLMQRFTDEKIPITVATIDMDWHWVDIEKKFGKESRDRKKHKNFLELFYEIMSPGWTGYSWNTELFPQPEEFLLWLKQNNLKVTMNLHPASGCKFYEDVYKEFAEFMGIDSSTKQQIEFDITDEKFLSGYFKFLHHPHEQNGVDFWWIDWQQGKKTNIPGLDPLWALNHYHSLDIARDGKRPLILSRFAGAGSHRYPLGFSGDTAQTWETLNFQPYFTATASNIGYSWWSHDIGGHHFGIRDDELYLRWVQFGIFSPIMRLHSTANEFMGKEPWKYKTSVRKSATEALKFRHRLIPYIYSMNRRTEKEGRALCEPMYYHYPEDERAYKCGNEYWFGSELIVCPITQPTDPKTNLAGIEVFIPDGRYTDIFSDKIYNGGVEAELFRDEDSIPVLAKEGAIIPLDCNDSDNYSGNPTDIELLVFRGNSSFTLYEDDGETMAYKNGIYAETVFSINENEANVIFRINAASGDISCIPKTRNYTVTFRDLLTADNISIKKNGIEAVPCVINYHDRLAIQLDNISPDESIEIELCGVNVRTSPDKREMKIELMSKLQGKNTFKNVYKQCIDEASTQVPPELKGAFKELELLYYR